MAILGGVDESVAAYTQDQSFCAILYLHQHVLDKDIDFDQHQINVRQGKGALDRIVPLPDIDKIICQYAPKFDRSNLLPILAEHRKCKECSDAVCTSQCGS